MPKTHYYIRVSISPSNLNLISSIPLCNRTLRDTRRLPGLEPQQPCMRNHNPIINTKPLIRSIHLWSWDGRHSTGGLGSESSAPMRRIQCAIGRW